MKITTWNCNGALRKKLDVIDDLNSDILIVQECEDPSKSTKAYKNWASNFIWEGENKNKGIGIFAKQGIKLQRLDWNSSFTLNLSFSPLNPKLTWHTKELRQFIPFTIDDQILCLAVWTKGSPNEVFGYMGQFWKLLQIHKEQLSADNVLIVGDFNSNKVWDKPDRWWNHSDVIGELEALGISSLYHKQNKEYQGEESTPTFYHQRNISKPYHIDYAFTGRKFTGATLEIGERDMWIKLSDHMPLILNL